MGFTCHAGVAKWSNAADCKSAGFTPSGVRIPPPAPADVAQLVERIHGKNEVTGSIPVVGSSLQITIALLELHKFSRKVRYG